jgi:site-specific recombinase XerD
MAVESIESYLKTREDNFNPLFINYKRGKSSITDEETKRLSAYSIQTMVRKYSLKAGIVKKVTPHTLRHSFATNMLQNGADIRSVQELLGHASITTTQIYTHLTNKRLREIHEKFHE